MALYLGNNKVKINLNGVVYCLNLYSENPITNGIKLRSLEGYMLKDINKLYLTAKQFGIRLLSSDDDILQDSTGLYLTMREGE